MRFAISVLVVSALVSAVTATASPTLRLIGRGGATLLERPTDQVERIVFSPSFLAIDTDVQFRLPFTYVGKMIFGPVEAGVRDERFIPRSGLRSSNIGATAQTRTFDITGRAVDSRVSTGVYVVAQSPGGTINEKRCQVLVR